MKKVLAKYWNRFVDQHAIFLLASLLLFLFAGPMIQVQYYRELFYDIVLVLIAISGFVLIPKKRRGKIFLVLFTLNLITSLFDLANIVEPVYGISNLIWSIFFFKVLYEIFLLSLDKNYTSANALLNSVSGYIVLGIIGATFFEYTQNLGFEPFETTFEFYELLYFSFVTMTTLGYGDLLPVSVEGRTIAILLTICGQLYIAVVIAINLAKYLAVVDSDEQKSNLDEINEKLDRLIKEKEKQD